MQVTLKHNMRPPVRHRREQEIASMLRQLTSSSCLMVEHNRYPNHIYRIARKAGIRVSIRKANGCYQVWLESNLVPSRMKQLPNNNNAMTR